MSVPAPREQLELLGLDECLRRADVEGATPAERRRLRRRIEKAHEVLSSPPDMDELAFLHSGLCQTFLPHSRPSSNQMLWRRKSGRFSLIVQPGIIDDASAPLQLRLTAEQQEKMYVGVPYGPKSRLILIYLQSEGVKARTVNLGSSLSAWMRSLGLPVTGGPRGSIGAFKEQVLRVSRCTYTMTWDGTDARGTQWRAIRDVRIAEGLDMVIDDRAEWTGTVLLSEAFHEHLRHHAVPLDKRGLHHLADNSLGLDLYALFAYRLPRLSAPVHLSWTQLQSQLGSGVQESKGLARRIRDVLPDVLVAYPDAKFEVTRRGLLLKPSSPAVPRTMVSGYRLIEGSSA